MFWWLLFANQASVARVRHTLLFRQKAQSQSLAIATNLTDIEPFTYARAPNGYVYMASGLGPMLKWNGYRRSAKTAGVPAPTTKPVITGESGPTALITPAEVFVREVGIISNVGGVPTITITRDPATTIRPASEAAGDGTISGQLYAFLRFIDEDGNPSNLSPISDPITASNVRNVVYSSLEATTDPKIVRRQILRNRSGETLTWYVDIDTIDLTSTTLSSSKTDDDLFVSEAVPLFDTDGNNIANRYEIPPNDKPILLYYLGRLWAAGEVSYEVGHIETTYGSATITGVATNWPSALAGRFLYVVGASRTYEIESVDVATQTLILTEEYRESTDPFAVYAIQSAPAERNLVRYSEPGFYDAWPFSNSIEVGEVDKEGDAQRALVSMASFLYIFKRRNSYRLTFERDPGSGGDGGIFPAGRRGCINHRCWIHAAGMLYAIDELGVYRFTGADTVEDVSAPIQNLFWSEVDEGQPHINWEAAKYFHAIYEKDRATLRWFVTLSGTRLPRHAICFNHQTEQWWIEEYPFGIGASVVLELTQPVVALAGPGQKLFALSTQGLDIVNPMGGTASGTITDWSATWFEDADAQFGTDLVGCPVAITLGRGKNQRRMIVEVDGTRVYVNDPWIEEPDETSKYQIGAVGWSWRSGWYRWAESEQQMVRRIKAAFEPTEHTTMDLRVFENHSDMPGVWANDMPFTESEAFGVSTERGNPDAVIDMSDSVGFAQLRMDDGQEIYAWDEGFFSLEMRGFSSDRGVRVYQLIAQGSEQ